MSRCWCINLYDVTLKGATLKWIEINLLKTGQQLKATLIMSLCTRKPTPYSCLSSSHLDKPCICHLMTPHQSSSSAFQGFRVLIFQIPIDMFSLPLIFLTFVTPVEYLSLSPQCPLGAVIVNPGCDLSGTKVSLGLLSMMFLG